MTKQDIRTSEYGKKRIGGLSKKDATMAYLNIPHRPKRGRGGDSYSHLTHFYRYGRADYSFWQFLGAFVKLKEATIDFLPVCLSVRMEQPGPHWTNYYEILYFSIFRKSTHKITVSLKSDNNNGCFS